jgi:quinol monooxygenase YgiN
MFARIVEFTPKLAKKDELLKVLRKDVTPILKSQAGFLEFLPFVPDVAAEKWVAVTLWAEKRDAERYEIEVYPKVEGLLNPYLNSPVNFRHYNVETSLCQHFVEALTA